MDGCEGFRLILFVQGVTYGPRNVKNGTVITIKKILNLSLCLYESRDFHVAIRLSSSLFLEDDAFSLEDSPGSTDSTIHKQQYFDRN